MDLLQTQKGIICCNLNTILGSAFIDAECGNLLRAGMKSGEHEKLTHKSVLSIVTIDDFWTLNYCFTK